MCRSGRTRACRSNGFCMTGLALDLWRSRFQNWTVPEISWADLGLSCPDTQGKCLATGAMPSLWGKEGWLGDPACHPVPAFHAHVCVVFRNLCVSGRAE